MLIFWLGRALIFIGVVLILSGFGDWLNYPGARFYQLPGAQASVAYGIGLVIVGIFLIALRLRAF